ncbi:MAG: hypothetical protein ACD_37C00452G0002 [uncultured bacterium]|nr:MAG: hypothetical protein ACD_37C00452G0002 [uncultured bacterium]KKR15764.1 MAG: hypothetical protein UT44_C0024G0005 [Candidatus Levybacteria bacterium GW2011_GWA1_39_32]KKR50291.1 MAG: hypothetical protein UT87_C0018G0009 [Candidatus Levybacteria bacterium GW2011_GWC1_40_19]KKR71457.1 MAG: hypothetical protein UU15_C0051G0002 [Candidatus Levybacteria bacterium GW2011_GWC2_40_7]KKR94772.1 MAG: hypothetical protein UU45_C0007G0020 [Candidatus Levybacteria bacterium GW2011_GWA2_41_15]HBB763
MNAQYMKWVELLGTLLVIVGALNWGLMGLLNLNVVNMVLGGWPVVEQVVYILVGVSGLWLLWDWYAKMSKK